jgi:hypothetical protein
VQKVARSDRHDGCISSHGRWLLACGTACTRPAGNNAAVQFHLWNIHKACAQCNLFKGGTCRPTARAWWERLAPTAWNGWSQNQPVKTNVVTHPLRGDGQAASKNRKQIGPSMSNVNEILADGSRYGVFSEHARVTQGIKDRMRDPNWKFLEDDMKESWKCWFKMAGLNGDPDYADWVDIAVFAVDRQPP